MLATSIAALLFCNENEAVILIYIHPLESDDVNHHKISKFPCPYYHPQCYMIVSFFLLLPLIDPPQNTLKAGLLCLLAGLG